MLLLLALTTLPACRWVDDAQEVAYQQTRPKELLRKYEWFKDASAQLEKKRADITVYQARLAIMNTSYEGTPRAQWPRADLEQYNLWQTEAAGVIAGYNSLAAEYNSQMSKANWAFCNAGSLPAGATEPLPREFATYMEH